MKVGIVGVGAMGSTHAAAWKETPATIVGFVAEHPEHTAQMAARYEARPYPDLASLLPDIDVVDICTPTHLHDNPMNDR